MRGGENAFPWSVLPSVGRRSPESYYAQTTKGAVSLSTTRCLGLWVPMEAFRRGTLIVIEGSSSSGTDTWHLNIGGNANARALGVNTAFTATPGAGNGAWCYMFQQESDGIIATFRTAGFMPGATSVVVTTATATVFLQPLNFVEFSSSGINTPADVTMEIIPPQRNGFAAYQEVFAT